MWFRAREAVLRSEYRDWYPWGKWELFMGKGCAGEEAGAHLGTRQRFSWARHQRERMGCNGPGTFFSRDVRSGSVNARQAGRAGDPVLACTNGDTDLKTMKRYVKRRDDRLRRSPAWGGHEKCHQVP
jgi:hypothetical protein